MSKQKLVWITNIPNQYRVPLFNELNKQLEAQGIELLVIFGSATYKFRKSIVDESEFQFEYIILDKKNINTPGKAKGFLLYIGLLKELKKYKPDRIIVTGFSGATFKVWWKSLFFKTNYLIYSGSIDIGRRKIKAVKTFFRKLFISRANGFVAYGSLAKKYLMQLGAKEQTITPIGNTVDTEFFSKETLKWRKKLATDNKKHLTYLGYIYPGKNIVPLINMVEELTKIRKDFIFDVIGDGVSKEDMINLVKEKKLEDFVVFHGFKQKNELPKYLAKSNCLLFQTELDVWGLVLNEAMSAKIPCMASVNAGATYDLIKEGETGYRVDFNNIKEVTEKVNWILNHPEEMKILGEKASKLIQTDYTLEVCAKNIISGLNK